MYVHLDPLAADHVHVGVYVMIILNVLKSNPHHILYVYAYVHTYVHMPMYTISNQC